METVERPRIARLETTACFFFFVEIAETGIGSVCRSLDRVLSSLQSIVPYGVHFLIQRRLRWAPVSTVPTPIPHHDGQLYQIQTKVKEFPEFTSADKTRRPISHAREGVVGFEGQNPFWQCRGWFYLHSTTYMPWYTLCYNQLLLLYTGCQGFRVFLEFLFQGSWPTLFIALITIFHNWVCERDTSVLLIYIQNPHLSSTWKNKEQHRHQETQIESLIWANLLRIQVANGVKKCVPSLPGRSQNAKRARYRSDADVEVAQSIFARSTGQK